MEIELWWFLALPVFFVLGWLAARIDINQLLRESRALPRSYFTGLNFLLNEQPDKAIEAFLEAAKIDPETIELHFALGSLFRRRGETDRAIRVHKHLIDRDASQSQLTEEQRLHALSELGQDYLKAGLLDRAEEIFVKLRGTLRDEEALRNLLEIYQQEKEWGKAIAIAEQMPGHAEHLWQKEIAEFNCELANSDLLNGRIEAARQRLDAALLANRKCVRATLMLGELEMKVGAGGAASAGSPRNVETAIATWQRIEQQNPVFLALAAEKMASAYRELGREAAGTELLRGYLERHPSIDMLDAVYQAELVASGPEVAYVLVRDEMRRNPTLLGLDKLLEAQVLLAPPEKRAELELVKNLIHNHTRRVARYRCDDCGFKARQFHWRCPACGGWETFPPKRTEEFDLNP
ncbi:MAG: lipopolysaccharide assembly protein LapB [Gammaproteobacteria bacterium]|nr:lipopolysaccharide assembly protein LapB [Rhodocyclaceae bacterium]MBU3908520.1 lipopolysaccharide assembly protein LapB [Gammaproteobacteria bacterium]MBU4004548.1 lipopolysaccharide assembly protein LapB [Gammaproteobacteria bacterium]MBU4021151.1 lipopolysaccharide assembly protein LapB [Gammaproteobacteria bacterium]MBU4096168.1 lipopolysaccharide assembly protein LapB [Gammaproteobacteria bacterium]